MITKHYPFSPVLQLKDPLALLLVTLHVLSCRVAIASGKLHPTCVIHSPNLHYTRSPNLRYTHSSNLRYTHSPNLHYTHSPNLHDTFTQPALYIHPTCITYSPNLHYTFTQPALYIHPTCVIHIHPTCIIHIYPTCITHIHPACIIHIHPACVLHMQVLLASQVNKHHAFMFFYMQITLKIHFQQYIQGRSH